MSNPPQPDDGAPLPQGAGLDAAAGPETLQIQLEIPDTLYDRFVADRALQALPWELLDGTFDGKRVATAYIRKTVAKTYLEQANAWLVTTARSNALLYVPPKREDFAKYHLVFAPRAVARMPSASPCPPLPRPDGADAAAWAAAFVPAIGDFAAAAHLRHAGGQPALAVFPRSLLAACSILLVARAYTLQPTDQSAKVPGGLIWATLARTGLATDWAGARARWEACLATQVGARPHILEAVGSSRLVALLPRALSKSPMQEWCSDFSGHTAAYVAAEADDAAAALPPVRAWRKPKQHKRPARR